MTETKFNLWIELKGLPVYKSAQELSQYVWNIVGSWNYLAQKTIGTQWTRATDSISANIAEGYGRFYYREKVVFYYYARGSLLESYDWTLKAKQRNLLTATQLLYIQNLLDSIPKGIHVLINNTRHQLST